MTSSVHYAVKKERSASWALFSLTLGAFAIGMTEFVIMGLLTNIADDLQVSISSAGQLITGYALGVAAGGPIMTVLTYRMPRKQLLCALMVIFIAGNVLAALSSNYTILMIARIVTSFAHGTFFGIGSVVATGLVKPEKRASAIAMMMAGLTIANILGVPFGTFIGQQFGWSATFWVVAAFGTVAFLGVALLVPSVSSSDSQLNLGREFHAFRKPQVMLALAMSIFGFGGVFTAFTYIAPILQDITGFREDQIPYILLLFGVGVTLGNLLGGKLADRRLMPSLMVCLALLTAILIVFYFTDHLKAATVVTIFLWGTFSFAIVPGLQMRVLDMAKDAPSLASTVNHSALNLSNAGGAFLGGLTVSGIGLQYVPLAAAIIAVIGLLITITSYTMERLTK
ncbi:arabinose transporter permease [Paenibacillus beijingensis]|uniref:Arabinose transporter permease n=1 Tax=Paenibacillus beijingensis TaxID=1126833 RepID=A0A0D5NR52_9BACL|nr:arabinose transporter permease [Paenibacillus beijingensis]